MVIFDMNPTLLLHFLYTSLFSNLLSLHFPPFRRLFPITLFPAGFQKAETCAVEKKEKREGKKLRGGGGRLFFALFLEI